MKKSIFSLLIISQFQMFALADNFVNPNSNWGIPLNSPNTSSQGEAEEQIWENEESETIYEKYGNDDSASYLNRQNIDVYDSNHGGSDFDLSQ